MKNKDKKKQNKDKIVKANLRQQRQSSKSQADKKAKRLALRFSPTAWAKLLYFRDEGDNEIGGFGITAADDLLFVTDFITVKQQVTVASVQFDDEAVADFFDDQVDLGRKPEQFARIWLHTHPSDSPQPSGTDEDTFQRVFGSCQWAVMFILAEDNSFAKLSFNVGPGGQLLIPVEVDYSYEFGSTEKESWDKEYEGNIEVVEWLTNFGSNKDQKEQSIEKEKIDDFALPQDVIDELENMEPVERQFVLDELAARSDLWDDKEQEVFL